MVKSKIKELHSLLVGEFGSDIEILDQNVRPLTKPGEHYGSIMLAVEVIMKDRFGKVNAVDLVAKLIPANELLRITFDIPVTFKKEAFTYLETIPHLVEFQRQHNVPKNKLIDQLFPKCYGARLTLKESSEEVDEDAIIILENLKLLGYKTEDRLKGFDFDASKIILENLARVHGVSLALKIRKPQVFKEKVMPSLKKNRCFEDIPDMRQLFQNSILDSAKQIEELKPFMTKLEDLIAYTSEHHYADRPPPSDLFGTLSHSDYWTNNIMILRDQDGKPLKSKMVDFQLMSYSSIVRDLLFYLFTSVVQSVLDDRFDDLVKVYYNCFIGTLEEFGIDTNKYSWDVFQNELNEVAPTEVYHILFMLKPICTEPDKVKSNLEDFKDDDWEDKDLLGPSHRRKLTNVVLGLAKRNWF